MASQTDGERQVQRAAETVMSGAPWQSDGDSSALESLTQSLVNALKDATESVNSLTAVQQSTQGAVRSGRVEGLLEDMTGGGSGLSGMLAGGVVGSLVTGESSSGGSFLSGGLLSPIISGIISLFSSGGHSAPPPIATFALPPSLTVDAVGGQATGGQLVGADFGADGLPRAQSAPAMSNITVQVNAMDSRSFLDRSADIATAVRQAILSSHSINDAISEL